MSYKTFKALVLIAVFSLLVSSVSASVFGQGKKTAKKPVKKKVDPLPAPTVPPNRVDPLPLPPLGPPEKSEFEQVANKLVNTVITKCGDKTYLIVEKELYAYSEKVHNLYLVDGVSSYVSEDQPTRADELNGIRRKGTLGIGFAAVKRFDNESRVWNSEWESGNGVGMEISLQKRVDGEWLPKPDADGLDVYDFSISSTRAVVRSCNEINAFISEKRAKAYVDKIKSKESCGVSYALMINSHIFIDRDLPAIKNATSHLLRGLRNNEECTLVRFDHNYPEQLVDFTTNLDKLHEAISSLHGTGGSSPVRAVIDGSEYLAGRKNCRKVLIVITYSVKKDKSDRDSETLENMKNDVLRNKIELHFIMLREETEWYSNNSSGIDSPLKLERLTYESGGGFYVLKNASQLLSVMSSILQKSQ